MKAESVGNGQDFWFPFIVCESNLISDADPSSLSYKFVRLLEVVFRVLDGSSDSLNKPKRNFMSKFLHN